MIENPEHNKCRFCGKYVESKYKVSKKERRPRRKSGKFHNFEILKSYEDSNKRPDGIKTIEYILKNY